MARHERWDSGWSGWTGNWWGETGEASDTSWSQVQLKRWGHDEGESWHQRQQRHFEGWGHCSEQGAWHEHRSGRWLPMLPILPRPDGRSHEAVLSSLRGLQWRRSLQVLRQLGPASLQPVLILNQTSGTEAECRDQHV
ncbi:unnamed protein product [Symbiodinium natans]|uniref:Uncharacterized protein n=1 Tax=Symbiodinium natans TaxID=878477 RepID=A0A812L705_9DINO|nr:unnamed protein product [Symbiodinium natans]